MGKITKEELDNLIKKGKKITILSENYKDGKLVSVVAVIK